MNRSTSRIFFAFATASSLLIGSPALAFNWACTAKDSAGTIYEGRMFGLSSNWTKKVASNSALRKCEAAGGQSCEMVECTDLDARYAIE
jgi:hypothetical protein